MNCILYTILLALSLTACYAVITGLDFTITNTIVFGLILATVVFLILGYPSDKAFESMSKAIVKWLK